MTSAAVVPAEGGGVLHVSEHLTSIAPIIEGEAVCQITLVHRLDGHIHIVVEQSAAAKMNIDERSYLYGDSGPLPALRVAFTDGCTYTLMRHSGPDVELVGLDFMPVEEYDKLMKDAKSE